MESDYEVLDSINSEHKIYLVKNILDKQIYVKKILEIYNIGIYDFLLSIKIDGIPKIKEIINKDKFLIVFEEYIPGKNIEEELNDGKIFTEKEVINIAASTCLTLSELNKKINIVHRDIKPSNIIFNDNGVYLLDFNAAKFVEEDKNKDTVLLGTEGYAAPEQYGFGSSTIQTDIYAIGILIKELTNPHQSKIFQTIIVKCTQLDPKNRYKSYELLLYDLKKCYYHLPLDFTPVGFRSKKISHIIIAILGYLLIFITSFGSEVQANDLNTQLTTRFLIFFSLLSWVAINHNYLNIQSWFAIDKYTGIKKIILIILLDFGVFFVYILLFATIDIIVGMFNK